MKCATCSGARPARGCKLFRTLSLAQHRARIAREAHSLKSAAGTFGYVRLAALALRLENTAETLGDAEFGDLLDLMDAAYAAATRAGTAGLTIPACIPAVLLRFAIFTDG